MFPAATLLAVAATFAASVSAAPGLSLSISAPKTVEGVQNLKVNSVLKNTGDETLRILNDPRTPLSKLDTKAFSILGASGASPVFKGAIAKYDPERAAAAGAFTVLEAGKTLNLSHDLSSIFNFTSIGEGAFTFAPDSPFTLVKEDGTLETLEPEVNSVETALSGVLAMARPSVRRRASYPSCSDEQKGQIDEAYPAAGKYASGAADYLSSQTSGTDRYTTWFGAYDDGRHSTVSDHYTKISAQDWASFTYDCSCTEQGVFAFVYPDTFGEIHLCPVFWTVDVTGTDSKAGTLVHESSHFTKNGGTDDHVYGQSGAKDLASSNPDQAIDNADNHEYFAENNPALD
jgi:peptidyl-Lys metalloendopeptidase